MNVYIYININICRCIYNIYEYICILYISIIYIYVNIHIYLYNIYIEHVLICCLVQNAPFGPRQCLLCHPAGTVCCAAQ